MRLATTIAKIGTACAVLAAVSASAQKSDNSQTAPRASIIQVTGQTTDDQNQSPGCAVNLSFTGGGVEHARCTRNLRIDEAVDDLGHDLRTEQPPVADYGIFAERLKDHPLTLEILLINPPRRAATIKELKGDVQLFTSTDVNGGQVTLPVFSSTSEKPMDDPILKKYQIQLFNITPPDFKGFKKNQRKVILNAARKAGLTEEDIRNLKEDIYFLGDPLITPQPGRMFLFYRKDPKNMIIQARFRDASGNWIEPEECAEVGTLSLITFDTEPPPKTDFVLNLAVPDAVKDCPFDFHNISLP